MGQGRVPGCPPPIASFIDYADNVLVPKVRGCNEGCGSGRIRGFCRIWNKFRILIRIKIFFLKFGICPRSGAVANTVCPRISDPFYIVSYYIKWVPTFWTDSRIPFENIHANPNPQKVSLLNLNPNHIDVNQISVFMVRPEARFIDFSRKAQFALPLINRVKSHLYPRGAFISTYYFVPYYFH